MSRTFGTVLISFAASSLPLLTDVHSDIELLQFNLTDADMIKSVVPNKQVCFGQKIWRIQRILIKNRGFQLLLPDSVAAQHGPSYHYQFDRLGLANWLLGQKKEKPDAAFFNAEVSLSFLAGLIVSFSFSNSYPQRFFLVL